MLDDIVQAGLGAELRPDFYRAVPAKVRAGEHRMDPGQALDGARDRVLQAVEDRRRRQLPAPARLGRIAGVMVERIVVADRPGEAARRVGVNLGVERRGDPAHGLADAGAKLCDIRLGDPAVRHV